MRGEHATTEEEAQVAISKRVRSRLTARNPMKRLTERSQTISLSTAKIDRRS
jgi:hypothetical protein